MIGTSSVRRQSQLLHRRPDLGIALLRGNVQTRLNKVNSGDGADASLLALAGLRRLGLDPADGAPAGARSDGAGRRPGHHRHHHPRRG